MIAPAPYLPPPLLEAAFLEARVLAARAPDPIDVLADPASTPARKLAAETDASVRATLESHLAAPDPVVL